MKKFLALALACMFGSVVFAQLPVAWDQTTYRTEYISGSKQASTYVCDIKGQTYTFKGEMAEAAEKYLKTSSVVHVFLLNEQGPVHVYALDNWDRKVYIGADYVFNTGKHWSYYNEKTNGIFGCTSSAFLVPKRKLYPAKEQKGYLLDEDQHLIIYD